MPTYSVDYLFSDDKNNVIRCPACPQELGQGPKMEVWTIEAHYRSGAAELRHCLVAVCTKCRQMVPLFRADTGQMT
jgi:hypothetical protein